MSQNYLIIDMTCDECGAVYPVTLTEPKRNVYLKPVRYPKPCPICKYRNIVLLSVESVVDNCQTKGGDGGKK